MRLSQTAEYALRAALHLAEYGGESALPVGEIAHRLSVPKNYLAKILHQLGKAGVLTSTRGPGGGFRLAVAADQLTLAEIVSPVDASNDARRCLLGHAECSNDDPCVAHEAWREAADTVRAFFQETTLADLSEKDR